MRLPRKLRSLTGLFTVAAIVYALQTKQSNGSLLKIPFEFRVPALPRARERWWNREDHRVFTPRLFGVGWSLNLYQVLKRLGIVGKHEEELAQAPTDEISPT